MLDAEEETCELGEAENGDADGRLLAARATDVTDGVDGLRMIRSFGN